MTRVRLFVPHHRGVRHLGPLFQSLREMEIPPGVEFQTVLADNGSADGSREFAQRAHPEVDWLPMGGNLGFAPALNRAAEARECDWAGFMNNDMRADAGWLREMLKTAEETGAPCVASPLWDWEGRAPQFAGGEINWFGKGFERAAPPPGIPEPVFFPCGGAMLIRRDVFLACGGFDPVFFMIYEDIDLGWRLWLLGHSVCLAPGARVFHRGHASLKSEQYAKKAVYLERNSMACLYKNLDASRLAALLPLAAREVELRAKALSGIGTPFRYSSDGLCTLRGLEAFWDRLDEWRERREWIQARRRRPDAEIIERFFREPERPWAYSEEHYRRIHVPETLNAIRGLLRRAGGAMRDPGA